MREFKELHAWMETIRGRFSTVDSLPEPTFARDGRRLISFSTNNYLGLATSPRLIQAARHGLERYGVGNCESRLLGGDLAIYRDLEAKLATLKGKDSAMLLATGYLTNLGVLSTLPNSAVTVRFYGFRPTRRYRYAYFTDELNHISIREGIRMSGAEKAVYRHCDMNHLESQLKNSDANTKIIVTDGVFSQDGDIAPLPDMLDLADRYDAMVYVDDAHGTGVLGRTGAGATEYFGLDSPRLICMGTLSKAYGAIGGFIAAESWVVEVLRLTCSAYGFTSTLPPDQAFAVSEAIDMVHDEPQRRERLWANQRYFIQAMDDLGFRLLSRETPIVPVWIGNEDRCLQVSRRLDDAGFHVDAIVFPAVPRNQSRLRFSMNANHTREQIDRLVGVLAELASPRTADEIDRRTSMVPASDIAAIGDQGVSEIA
ncbi:MAG: pyridoxal phosphate-dependent aminotransferase family protein [Thermoguttaceae bacterium]